MASQQQNSGVIKKIYKTRKTILELLKSQGYDTEDEIDFSINEIHAMYQNKELDMLLENKDTSKKTYVKYHIHSGLRPQIIHDIIDDLFHTEELLNPDRDNLVIITKDPPNDTLTSLLEQIFADDGVYIIIMNIARLQFNILEHEMVPRHEVMTNDEVEEFKKRYNIKNTSVLPTISRFDPVAQAIGIRPNEYCHITRPSKTAIEGHYYRICLNK